MITSRTNGGPMPSPLRMTTLETAEGHLQAARAHLAQLYDGNHVDARHLVDALAALRLARFELDAAIHDGVVVARDLAVPWSVIGQALGTSKQNAYQRHGRTSELQGRG